MSKSKTNVIVFFTDQQRWDTTGIHGNPLDLTPNFDRMAMEGTHLHNFFTCQPLCGPARSCLQTGMYATQSGCYRNYIPLQPDHKTLAHYFTEAGYQTGYIGKWHLATTQDTAVLEHERGGYAYWLASDILEFTSDGYDTVVFDNDNNPVKLPGYRVDALTDAAIRYINSHQDDPFFLFVSYLEPHQQNHRDDHPAPFGYQDRYTSNTYIPPDLAALGGSTHQQIGGYYGMVKRLDEALGRLIDSLFSLGILDDTIVLFTSDHGNHFKTRNDAYKRSVHDASIRVPAAIIGPGFNGGGRIQNMVSLIDLPPTLLDAVGIAVPDHMQGHSLLPLIKKETLNWQEEIFVQVSEAEVARAIRTKRWKYGVTAPDADPIHDSGSKEYIESYLYDLMADPYELDNRVGSTAHRDVADKLMSRLVERMVQAGEDEPLIHQATPVELNPQYRVP
ncbi:MAG: sulfatase-like hydrolase/transferase [Aggregatilineales bacterium]